MAFLPRLDMALSLGFHIIFASIGMTMPLLMVLAEHRWRRTGDPEALRLSKAWAKGTAVLFAVGAVSGTVLAFELGLLFPKFMERAGPVIGLPFALEGVAFFTEAVFLGLYLYGWERLKPAAHLAAGWMVVLSGFASAAFVTLANAWMQTPVGFKLLNGEFTEIDPIAALLSPSAGHEVPHGVLASYAAVATAVAALHAWRLLKHPGSKFDRLALRLAVMVALPANLLQPLLGHRSGMEIARLQPIKLAALEGHFESQTGAPMLLGGWPDYAAEETRWAIPIPYALSWLATGKADGFVAGLKGFDRDLWPPRLARFAFQTMILFGTLLAFGYTWVLLSWVRSRSFEPSKRLLRALVWLGPCGIIALETGWIAAEVGRQPWIIYNVMRTSEAVSDRPALLFSLLLFVGLYLGLGLVVGKIILHYVKTGPSIAEASDGTY